MNSNQRWWVTCAAVAAMTLGSGCAWDNMTKADKGTTVGAGGGAVAGAVVGGPVGAIVGAGVGAYAGNAVAGGPVTTADATSQGSVRADPQTMRVQQALNDRGFGAGAVDGQWGPSTEDALRRFQQAAGLPVTGAADRDTLVALGVR